MLNAALAVAASMRPLLRTSAKSRTRRNKRLAIRGVPRERLAISKLPLEAISTLSKLALRLMICCNSSLV